MSKFLAVTLLAVSAVAQNTEQAKPPAEVARKVVELKYLTGPRAERAQNLIYQFMRPAGSVFIDTDLKTAVLTGTPDAVAGAEALLRKFDVPGDRAGAQVALTMHLVEASMDENRGGTMPKEITPAVEQMKRAFQYKNYRLLESILIVGRANAKAVSNGVLPTDPVRGEKATYEASYNNLQVFEDAKSVALKDFRVNLDIPNANGGTRRTGIMTDVNIQAGQKLVIGKLSGEQAPTTIFIVLTADIQ